MTHLLHIGGLAVVISEELRILIFLKGQSERALVPGPHSNDLCLDYEVMFVIAAACLFLCRGH